MDLKKRREEQQTKNLLALVIDVDGDKLTLEYRRASLTAGDARRLSDLMRQARQAESAGGDGDTSSAEIGLAIFEIKQQFLLQRVAQWDLTNDGDPVALTPAGLEAAGVDLDLIDLILNAINGDEAPNPTSAPLSAKP